MPTSVLTPVLAALSRHSPDIDLGLRQGPQPELCDRMLDSELDMALMAEGAHTHDRLHRWKLFVWHYVLICAPEHRLRDHERVSVGDLSTESLLLNENVDCPMRRFVSKLCQDNGVTPRQHFTNSQE